MHMPFGPHWIHRGFHFGGDGLFYEVTANDLKLERKEDICKQLYNYKMSFPVTVIYISIWTPFIVYALIKKNKSAH